MPDCGFCLDQLTPTEALQVLAAAAAKTGGHHLDEITLQVLDSTFGTEVTVFIPEVTIFIPEVHAQKERREDRGARARTSEALANAFRQVTGRERRGCPVPDDAVPLSRGVAWLLFHSFCSPNEEPASKVEQEYLLVGHGISDIGRAASILEDLHFHATHVRIAAAETKGGPTFYFFHVLDDHRRCSSFLSANAANAFPECSILTCFNHQGSAVFLPQEKECGANGLAHFCRLLQAAPSIFGITDAKGKHGLLAAIDRWPSETSQPTLLPLVGLRFYSQVRFTPWEACPADFAVVDLEHSEAALDQLRTAIEREKPYVGYRLELRPVKHREPVEQEQKKLREQQAEIEYRLGFLDSMRQPRPTLLRFTQRQLPALADVIRSFDERVIRKGVLKYGFQATDNDAGLHFILVEPQNAVTTELDPLLLWHDLDNRPMRFWVDPCWARHYYGPGNRCLIFVPEGTTLFPPLHAWNTTDMDEYMRSVMGCWFHNHDEVAKIPTRPIYVFDTETPSNAHLQIYVLDQNKMQPLHTQLGWMNDNLTIMDAVGIEPFIKKMADGITREELARNIEKRAESAEEDFRKRAQETSNNVAGEVAELVEVVSGELARIVKEIEKTVKEAQELDERLRRLEAICKEMSKVSGQADKLKAQARRQAQRTEDTNEKQRKKIEATLKKAREFRQRIGEQISTEIDRMRSVRNELQHELSKL